MRERGRGRRTGRAEGGGGEDGGGEGEEEEDEEEKEEEEEAFRGADPCPSIFSVAVLERLGAPLQNGWRVVV